MSEREEWRAARERLKRYLANPDAVLSNGALIGGIIRLPDLRLAISLADRVEALEAALGGVLADIEDCERINRLAPNPGRGDCWQSVTRARLALEGKTDG